MYRILIANKNYSSWSLRAWVVLAELGVDFEEQLLPFTGDDDQAAERRAASPTGKVPCLIDGSAAGEPVFVWDSLAIAEYLAAVVKINTRHLKTVPLDLTNTVAAHDARHESTEPDGRTEQLRKTTKIEHELAIEAALRVSDARHVIKAVSGKEIGITIIFSHMNEHDAAAAFLDLSALLRNISQRFATEGATCVSEKYDQLRSSLCKLIQSFSRLCF